MDTSPLLRQIASIVGPEGILTGEEVYSRSTGWISREQMEAIAIVRPRCTEEVSGILRLCHGAGQPVVPQGGLTGLVDGSRSGAHEIALSTERMNAIEEL